MVLGDANQRRLGTEEIMNGTTEANPPSPERLGSDDEWVECWNCGGDGYADHDCGEDCCCCADPEPNVVCHVCHGKGGQRAGGTINE